MYPENPVQQPDQSTPQVFDGTHGPTGQLSPESQPNHNSHQSAKQKKMFIIIAAAGVGFVVLLVILAVVFGGKPTPKKTPTTTTSQQSQGPSAATALSTQQNVDAISQNLSSLDDNKDFPPAALDDTTLSH